MSDESAGWLARLRRGLGRSSAKIGESLSGILRRHLDPAAMRELEDALIAADLGPTVAARLVQALASARPGEGEDPRVLLADEITKILGPMAKPLTLDPARRPHVILVAGVNGSGKTTTIAKLARIFRDQGRTVLLAAGDTFRAAAIEQLQIWGERAGAAVVVSKPGGDSAALAFVAFERARAEGADVLMIDTAGRLHNKADLMAELQKIVRVLKKLDPSAPHDCVLVMDANVGQNAIAQVATFRELADVTGLVLTKLDGTAKGGVVVALAEKFALPIHAVGVGEGIDDLRPFEARAFARALLDLAD
ncbi:MAG: signal recognition particle-docking protein FtsY [Rhodospirillales bacterium]|nr:signal recognition particle-docking protein FtsY [Rhodospirillales bacterium]MSP80142.1 signal recognition particle-docking protein FtsY [Rhodospirillales bacterium]